MDTHTRARLTAVLEREGLEVLVVTTPENLFYVTGFRSISHALFRGAEYYGVFTRAGTGLVTPFIDATGIATEPVTVDRVVVYGRFVFEYAEDPQAYGRRVRELTAAPKASAVEALLQVLGDLGGRGPRIGLDEGAMLPETWRRVSEALAGATIAPAYQLLRGARMVKSPEEVACLARAAQIAEDGVTAVLGMLKPGVTEREAARVFEEEVIRRGATLNFTVVTMGERASLSDVYPSDRALRPGDLVRFDLGCTYRSYRSDIARTAVLGAPTEKQARYYAAALAGEQAGIEAMKPGVTAREIFALTMDVTRRAGIPHYQRTHVGHGIGLEPYDPPTLNADNDTVLEPGMVFCVETPYYEHGWGGVQVEDTVEITPAGARMLHRGAHRELTILG